MSDNSASLAIHSEDRQNMDRVVKFRYKWSVRSFIGRREKTGHKMSAPAFLTEPLVRASWSLDLYPRGDGQESQDYLSIHLRLLDADNFEAASVKVAFSILDYRGDTLLTTLADRLVSNGRPVGWGWSRFVRRDMLMKKDLGLLAKDGTLNLMCEVSVAEDPTAAPSQQVLSPGPAPGNPMEDLGSLLNSPRFSDVVLVSNDVRFRAHKAILATRSPSFGIIFESDALKDETNDEKRDTKVVEIPDVTPEVLEQMLHYIYTGRIPRLDSLGRQLLVAAEKYGLDKMKEVCEGNLMRAFTVSNAVDLLDLADMHDADMLKGAVIEFINRNAAEVMATEAWKAMIVSRPQLLADLFKALADPDIPKAQDKSTPANNSG